MFTIYTKTKEEIESEEAIRAQIHGNTPICKTYVKTKDGRRINTTSLSDEQIITLIDFDINDFLNPNGYYKRDNRTDLDSFKLAKALGKDYKPSYDLVLNLLAMYSKYGHIVMDIMADFNCGKIYNKASIIVEFQKQTNGNYEAPTIDEIIGVINQMKENEFKKETNLKK